MEYSQQTYLRDTDEESDINGIAVLEVSESDGYRLTEQRDGEWCKPFWMPESELLSHSTEVVGNLSSDQYLRLCQKVGATDDAVAE